MRGHRVTRWTLERCVSTRAMRTTRKEQDNKQQHHDEDDEPKHFHPAWCAGEGMRVSHVPVLLCRVLDCLNGQ